MRDFPEVPAYKGSFCTIIDVYLHPSNRDEDQYGIEFGSWFKDNDPSRKSEASNPDFKFSDSNITLIVRRDEILRVEFEYAGRRPIVFNNSYKDYC